MRLYLLLPMLLLFGLAACGDADKVEVDVRDDSTTVVDVDTSVADTAASPWDPDTTGAAALNVRVSEPKAGDRISGDSLTIRGTARTFENTVNYRLLDAGGKVVMQGAATALGELGNFNPYSFTIAIPRGYDGRATLEVYQASAKDGSMQDRNVIPLYLQNTATTGALSVEIYLPNSHMGSGEDCSKVLPIRRTIGRTPAVAEAALRQLLKGPTEEERAKGYHSEIPGGAALRDITIENGVARADFNGELNNVAGSCRVQAIRAEIERTLRQFPTVREVVISVEGKSEGILQP